MSESTEEVLKKIQAFEAKTAEEVEQFRIAYLGKKGVVKDLSSKIKEIPSEERRAYGQMLNQIKTAVTEKIEILKAQLDGDKGASFSEERPDETLRQRIAR